MQTNQRLKFKISKLTTFSLSSSQIRSLPQFTSEWIKTSLRHLFSRLLKPVSPDKDTARREFVLNVILLGIITLTTISFLLNLTRSLLYPDITGEQPGITGGLTALLIGLMVLSRRGHSRISSGILTLLLLVVGVYGSFFWGADLSAILLLYSLIIIMTGILLGTKSSIVITLIISLITLIFTYLQEQGFYRPSIEWKNQTIRMADSTVYVVFFVIISTISWLFNREVSSALRRAQKSETRLKKERDLLEVKVEARTRELKQTQAEKMLQLYRFAEIGRSASGMFHDLAGPLNLISLNLEKLNIHNSKLKSPTLTSAQLAIERAITGTRRIESFISTARKQLQDQKVVSHFSANDEVTQAIQMMDHRARSKAVEISFIESDKLKIWGNPVKFYQIIINLIANAIDSYDQNKRLKSGKNVSPGAITVSLKKQNGICIITVSDQGSGIPPENITKIFTPLFTTKPNGQGIGLGLSITKEIVEKDFNGRIEVSSTENKGSSFTVSIGLSG